MMKYKYKKKITYILCTILFSFGSLLLVNNTSEAQEMDTLFVEWLGEDGSPEINALRNTILADTLDDGSHPQNRVYLLERGGFYWISDRIVNDGFPLRIVGQTVEQAPEDAFVCGPNGDQDCGPAIFQRVENPESDAEIDTRMITGLGDVVLKNLWITGQDDNGVQTAFQPIQLDASDSRYTFINNVFTLSNFAIPAISGTNNDVVFRDNKFRNLQGKPADQQWQGRGIEITASQDSIIIENNTFFNVNFTSFQMQNNTPTYLRFNQNTIVNNGRQIISGGQWDEAYFTNNLIVNGWWHGEGNADLTAPGREFQSTGMFQITDLPTSINTPSGRRIAIANNASWRDPAFNTFYADSIQSQYFINAETRGFLDLPQVVIQDTLWVDQPDLGTYPAELVESMWANINDIRTGQIPATTYFYKVPTNEEGQRNPLAISWPLPEDFSYTDENLMDAGTNGMPLGDLNWFPDIKQQWENQKEEEVETIEAVPGDIIETEVLGIFEAEEANTLSQDASVETVSGFKWLNMEGGFIEWTFELEESAVIGLDIFTNMFSNSVRGERVLVDGVNLRNTEALGEYTFCTDADAAECADVAQDQILPTEEWAYVNVRQENLFEGAEGLNLEAGTHTVRIEAVWAFQGFSNIDVVNAENDEILTELKAEDATIGNNIFPTCEDTPFCPSGFKRVNLPAGNSLGWDVELEEGGEFVSLVTYQAPDGTQPGDIIVNGNTESTEDFTGMAGDSSGVELETSTFMLSGSETNTIAIQNQGDGPLYIDNIALVRLGTGGSTPIDDENLNNPREFKLSQNYPNPFNPSTTINFTIPSATEVELTVYNVLGEEVATLVNQRMSAGSHSVNFDASRLSSGMYIYRIEANDFVSNKKMILVK